MASSAIPLIKDRGPVWSRLNHQHIHHVDSTTRIYFGGLLLRGVYECFGVCILSQGFVYQNVFPWIKMSDHRFVIQNRPLPRIILTSINILPAILPILAPSPPTPIVSEDPNYCGFDLGQCPILLKHPFLFRIHMSNTLTISILKCLHNIDPNDDSLECYFK